MRTFFEFCAALLFGCVGIWLFAEALIFTEEQRTLLEECSHTASGLTVQGR